uniref:Uncharacterized protein n=1 Tax=Meloidogyne enterolobii TaxID=390850 RepID=A0A6V7TUQ9_MELEN|nr:unnamed protein product [Meloidogyne enterolobii]
MNSGTRFFALFLLLVVNLSFFNEVNAWYLTDQDVQFRAKT